MAKPPSSANDASVTLENLELRLLVTALSEVLGLQFENYALASLKRRVQARVQAEGVGSIAGLLARVLHDPQCLERLIEGLTIHVTAMFRDPHFYAEFRRLAVPLLRTWPQVRIWVAGCSSGEEAYSLAIILIEEGLAARSRIYATDISEKVLQLARSGTIPLGSMKEYTENYIKSGGKHSFSSYYTANKKYAVIRSDLADIISFERHDLATNPSFQTFHAVLCRNVMIYFDAKLQGRVHDLIYQSILPGGILALGSAETIRFSVHEQAYETLDAGQRLYRRLPNMAAPRAKESQ